MNLVIFSIFLFCSVLGLIYFFNLIQHIMFYDSKKFKNQHSFKIIVLKGEIKDIEFLIRKQLFKNKFLKDETDLIFLDAGLDKKTKEILLKLCQTYNFKVCEKKNVYTILQSEIKK